MTRPLGPVRGGAGWRLGIIADAPASSRGRPAWARPRGNGPHCCQGSEGAVRAMPLVQQRWGWCLLFSSTQRKAARLRDRACGRRRPSCRPAALPSRRYAPLARARGWRCVPFRALPLRTPGNLEGVRRETATNQPTGSRGSHPSRACEEMLRPPRTSSPLRPPGKLGCGPGEAACVEGSVRGGGGNSGVVRGVALGWPSDLAARVELRSSHP
jgi:hypothetical protein